MSNIKTIARNTGWYGLETTLGNLVSLITAIGIGRYLGPEKNAYIIYVSYIASLVSSLGSFGIPATTRKYMAEFIGMGDHGTARYIYFRTLLLQTVLATLATGGLLVWVLGDARGDYIAASALLVLSIWPSMVNAISSQANAASEDMSANMPASVISAFVYLICITATIVLHWGVIGVGAALLSMRAVDFLVRFFPTINRVLAWNATHAHPPELHKRMMAFAWKSVASMAVALVVWGRPEVILLKNLSADIRQVAYYSAAFSLAGQLLLGATIFGSASSLTVFVQYGRDKSRLPAITASTFRYLALISIPLHMIATVLAAPALRLLYGHKWEGAAVVVTIAPMMCLLTAFLAPARSLLESSERQSYVIAATVLAAIADLGLAWYLIPAHGAVGACIANGAAQALAVGMMWAAVLHLFKVKLPWVQVAKIAIISLLASAAAYPIAVRLAPLWAILCGGSAALIVLAGLFYLMRVLEPEDRNRFKVLAGMLPGPIAGPVEKMLSLLIRPEFAGM